MKTLKSNAEARSCTDVGPGDYVKVGGSWEKIASNTAFGQPHTPRHWTVRTDSGMELGMFNIRRYAKAEDLEG